MTGTRAGLSDGVEYLYTLNLACPQDLWDDLEPVFKQVRITSSPLNLACPYDLWDDLEPVFKQVRITASPPQNGNGHNLGAHLSGSVN